MAVVGSSPLAWGTHGHQQSTCRSGRFIPTRVGNTCSACCARFDTCGSSPLAWGTPHFCLYPSHPYRFIPTRVGNTCVLWRKQNAAFGSSPLAWGTPFRAIQHTAQLRFIPTRVGNTPSGVRPHATGSVHPHSRGEHLLPMADLICTSGSSPLAWGTQQRSMMA